MNKALTGKGRRPTRGGPFPGIVSVAALIVLWAVVAAISDDPRRLPSPLLVLQRLAEIAATGELWFHAGMTLMRVAVAFVAAMLVGGALGLWMGRAGAADRWLNPLLVILLNIPALVVIVLCYIWIGLNETAAVLAVALNKIPVVAVLLREQARALRPDLDDMGRVFGMGPVARLRHIVLPIATRVAFPGWLNLVLSVMKDTALVMWIGIVELLRASQTIVTRIQEPLLVLCIAGLIYYVMSLVVAQLGARLEKRWQEND